MYLFLLTGNFYLPPTGTLSNDSFQNEDFNVNLYPNPSKGIFTLTVPTSSKIEVVNVQGKIVLEKEMNDALTTSIDLSSKAVGIYYMKVINNDRTVFRKIVLE